MKAATRVGSKLCWRQRGWCGTCCSIALRLPRAHSRRRRVRCPPDLTTMRWHRVQRRSKVGSMTMPAVSAERWMMVIRQRSRPRSPAPPISSRFRNGSRPRRWPPTRSGALRARFSRRSPAGRTLGRSRRSTLTRRRSNKTLPASAWCWVRTFRCSRRSRFRDRSSTSFALRWPTRTR